MIAALALRVLLVDDGSLRQLPFVTLQLQDGFVVVGEEATGHDGIAL